MESDNKRQHSLPWDPIEELKWYYLTHTWWDKRFHSIPKASRLKVNTIAQVVLELTYYDVKIQHVSHYATEIPYADLVKEYFRKFCTITWTTSTHSMTSNDVNFKSYLSVTWDPMNLGTSLGKIVRKAAICLGSRSFFFTTLMPSCIAPFLSFW